MLLPRCLFFIVVKVTESRDARPPPDGRRPRTRQVPLRFDETSKFEERQVRRRSPPERLPPIRTSPLSWVSSSSTVNPEALGFVKSEDASTTLNHVRRPSPKTSVPRTSSSTSVA
ncbi:hypothetical protein VPH35_103916 [Triticum aestivum]